MEPKTRQCTSVVKYSVITARLRVALKRIVQVVDSD